MANGGEATHLVGTGRLHKLLLRSRILFVYVWMILFCFLPASVHQHNSALHCALSSSAACHANLVECRLDLIRSGRRRYSQYAVQVLRIHLLRRRCEHNTHGSDQCPLCHQQRAVPTSGGYHKTAHGCALARRFRPPQPFVRTPRKNPKGGGLWPYLPSSATTREARKGKSESIFPSR